MSFELALESTFNMRDLFKIEVFIVYKNLERGTKNEKNKDSWTYSTYVNLD